MLEELNRSVYVTSLEAHLLPTATEAATFLLQRCGGQPHEWVLTPVKRGYLLKVPTWLHPADLVRDYEYWVSHHYMLILPWQTLDRDDTLPPKQSVILTIHSFPLDYWHPKYFRQVTAAMGILTGVSQEALRGENKTHLKLMIDCHDLKLIPHTLVVGHNGR